jgi:hypothetical protein
MNFMNFEKSLERAPNFEKESKKEVIEKLKELDLLLTDYRDVVLTMIGQKPLTMFGIKVGFEENLKEIAKKANLSFELKKDKDAPFYIVSIAKNEEIIRKAIEAQENGDDETLGKLFGFPETAAKAFAEAEKNPEKEKELLFEDQRDFLKSLSEEDRKQIAKERLLGFFEFRLSKAHWREELETVRRWKKALEEDPELAKKLSEGWNSLQVEFYREYVCQQ